MAPDRRSRSSKAKSTSKTPSRGASKGLAPRASTDGGASSKEGAPRQATGARVNQVIPDAVANRMARRIALATGLPTVLGMGVFIASYVLVSRHLLDIPPSATLLASGACFLLGLVGLSYGVLSASWEEGPGTRLGLEQIPLNISRLKSSIRALRDGARESGGA
ncbi:MAG: photosystem II biosynthesis protein [Cyanobacteriota bacterium]|jgi:hypothetical protein